eukprot:8672117-Alexandrium_andersonii.AAC.1
MHVFVGRFGICAYSRRKQHCQHCAVPVVVVAVSCALLGCGFADCGVQPASSRFPNLGHPRGLFSWADSESARTAGGSDANYLRHLPHFLIDRSLVNFRHPLTQATQTVCLTWTGKRATGLWRSGMPLRSPLP